jgi:pyridoxamine 5'-phosphate oxidase
VHDVTDRLASMRRSYERGGLREEDLADDWPAQFARWLAEAVAAGLTEPNACTLATAARDGRPSARTVLLKQVDARGFTVFTNLGSRKGREALANPRASIVVPWIELGRQVVVLGDVERVSDAESDSYFATRPHGSRIGALASPQSQVIPSREVLEQARDALLARFPPGTDVPRPPHWGGLRVVPESVEFWQGRPDRLHDRLRFRREDGGFGVERLAP